MNKGEAIIVSLMVLIILSMIDVSTAIYIHSKLLAWLFVIGLIPLMVVDLGLFMKYC